MAQLKPATANSAPDPYGRKVNAELSPVRNEGHEYHVERVLGKRMLWGKLHYLTKWADYGNEQTFKIWYATDDLHSCQDLVDKYEARIVMHPMPEARRSQKASQKTSQETSRASQEFSASTQSSTKRRRPRKQIAEVTLQKL